MHGSWPDFSSSSTLSRSSRASEPWWARAISRSPAASRRGARLRFRLPPRSSSSAFISLSRLASRSAPRRLLTKMIVDVCSRTSFKQLRVDRRPDAPGGRVAGDSARCRRLRAGQLDAVAGRGRAVRSRCGRAVGSAMSATGTTISRSISLLTPASTIVHSRCGPTRNFPIRSSGRCVAERPIRCTGASRPAPSLALTATWRSSRSRVSAMWAPRLVGATAWISSTITRLDVGEDVARLRGQHQVERLRRRDQDVGRLADHRLALALRGVAGPQGNAEVGADPGQRRPQVALDVVGERLQRRDVDERHAGWLAPPQPRRRFAFSRARRSIPQRNAVSVLPDPVGAQISVLSPVAIAGQPSCWAGVGRLERALEPGAGRLAESRQRVGLLSLFGHGGQSTDLGIGRAPPHRAWSRLRRESRVRRVDGMVWEASR